MIPPPPSSTLFPYTTLFRSRDRLDPGARGRCRLGRGSRAARRSTRPENARTARRACVTIVLLSGGGGGARFARGLAAVLEPDRKSTRLNSSHGYISYAVFCL